MPLRDGRLGLHLQAEGAGDFADAGEAGGGVVGLLVTPDLWHFQTQPFGQFSLAQAGGDTGLVQPKNLNRRGVRIVINERSPSSDTCR